MNHFTFSCFNVTGEYHSHHSLVPQEKITRKIQRKLDYDEHRYKAILAERAAKQRNLAKMTTAKSSSPSQRTSPRDALRRIRGAIGSISERPPVSRPDRVHKPLLSMKKRVMLPTSLRKKKKSGAVSKSKKVAPPLPPRNEKKKKNEPEKQETTYGLSTLWGLFG